MFHGNEFEGTIGFFSSNFFPLTLSRRLHQMKILAGLFFIFISSFSTAVSVAQSNNKPTTLNKALEAELLKMGEDDQKYRGVIES